MNKAQKTGGYRGHAGALTPAGRFVAKKGGNKRTYSKKKKGNEGNSGFLDLLHEGAATYQKGHINTRS